MLSLGCKYTPWPPDLGRVNSTHDMVCPFSSERSGRALYKIAPSPLFLSSWPTRYATSVCQSALERSGENSPFPATLSSWPTLSATSVPPELWRQNIACRIPPVQFYPEIDRSIKKGGYAIGPSCIFSASFNFWKKLNAQMPSPFDYLAPGGARALTEALTERSTSPERSDTIFYYIQFLWRSDGLLCIS